MCDCRIAIGVSDSLRLIYNSLVGPASAAVKQALLFITSKCNVTYIPYNFTDPGANVCSDNGFCYGVLPYLQTKHVDFIFKKYSTSALNNIGTNLTTTVQDVKDCVVIYTQNAITRYSSSTPFESLSEFGFETIIIFSCLMALLTLLFMTIIIQRTQSSLMQVIWNNFEYFSCQNSLLADCLTQKWIYGFYIIVLFIARILLTSNLQTGLIIDKHYIKLTSYKDIIEYNYKPLCLPLSVCHLLLVQSTDRYAKLVANKTKLIDPSTINWALTYNQIHQIGHATIEADTTYDMIKKIGCSYGAEEEKKFPLIKAPISYSFVGYLMTKKSAPKVKDVILKGLYAEVELRTTTNKRTQNHLYNSLRIKPAPSCYNAMETNSEDSETVPLKLHYIIDMLVMYAIGIAIACIVFACRLVF